MPWPPHDGTSSGKYVGDFSKGGLGGTGGCGLSWRFEASMVVSRAKEAVPSNVGSSEGRGEPMKPFPTPRDGS